MRKIEEILANNNIDPKSQVGLKLINKYETEMKRKKEEYSLVERQVIDAAKLDFEKHISLGD